MPSYIARKQDWGRVTLFQCLGGPGWVTLEPITMNFAWLLVSPESSLRGSNIMMMNVVIDHTTLETDHEGYKKRS